MQQGSPESLHVMVVVGAESLKKRVTIRHSEHVDGARGSVVGGVGEFAGWHCSSS